MDEFLEEEGKLGHGFTSADLLEEIDIGVVTDQGRCLLVPIWIPNTMVKAADHMKGHVMSSIGVSALMCMIG